MTKSKIATTLNSKTLRILDRWVRAARYPSRSQAIEAAVAGQLERLERSRLIEECAKLDPRAAREMAEEGFGADAQTYPEF